MKKVANALLSLPYSKCHAWELMKKSGLGSPALIRVLDQLEDAGYISGTFLVDASNSKARPRRFYTIRNKSALQRLLK